MPFFSQKNTEKRKNDKTLLRYILEKWPKSISEKIRLPRKRVAQYLQHVQQLI